MVKLKEIVLAAFLGLGLGFNAYADEVDEYTSDEVIWDILFSEDRKTGFENDKFVVRIDGKKFYEEDMNENVSTAYWKNGRKRFEEHSFFDVSTYKQMLHGTRTSWYENGRPRGVMNYQNNEKHGQVITWHQNGMLASKGKYFEGKKEGVWFEWYENGQMRWFHHYRNGERHGTQMMWTPEGKVSLEQNFIDGELFGRLVEWNSDGSGIMENYIAGRINGEKIWFDEQGMITRREEYREGKLRLEGFDDHEL